MNKLVSILFFLIQIFIFADPASAFSTELIAKFEITHSHHHDDKDEHQHEHDEAGLEAEKVQLDVSSERHTHQHEIIVGSQILYIQSDAGILFLKFDKVILYPKFSQEPPQDPFRRGTFRPPIFV